MTRTHFSIAISCMLALSTTSTVAATLCVKSEQANLRNGAGTQYAKSWEVYKFMPFQKLKRKGNWYQVRDVDGDRHWIHKSLTTEQIRCAVVKSSEANIRSGPGTQHPETDWSPVIRYYAFEVLEKKGRWARIQDSIGNTGWVASSLIWQP